MAPCDERPDASLRSTEQTLEDVKGRIASDENALAEAKRRNDQTETDRLEAQLKSDNFQKQQLLDHYQKLLNKIGDAAKMPADSHHDVGNAFSGTTTYDPREHEGLRQSLPIRTPPK